MTSTTDSKKAFVFGKFYPLHLGHVSLIRYALENCDSLIVLVCCSEKEIIPGWQRKAWIKETFSNSLRITVVVFNYDENELPNTSESSRAVSKLWSEKFKDLVPECKLLFTSEKYGEFVAEYMKINHQYFDVERHLNPISSSAIRNNLFENWKYLPNAVKSYYCFKVVILGTESTGKTELVKKLANHLNCSSVMEAGRDIIEDSNSFELENLYDVANEHAKRIKQAETGPSPIVIIDTDIHITISYGKFVFNKTLQVSEEIKRINKANLYLYLKNDVDFIQDGTRLDQKRRDALDYSHRTTLVENNISFFEIQGNWEERFEQALTCVLALLKKANSRQG